MNFRLKRVIHVIVSQHKMLAIFSLVVFGSLAWMAPAQALDIMGSVAGLLASIAQILMSLIGKILTVLIEILLAVVQYNDFINAPAVIKGWVLVRDISNMAFLIIFIAIAFATILGIEKYEYKQLLPKLLIMAVLINFSRTICGLIIDAAQVVMMTFVNGFKDVAAGNLIRGFGISEMVTLRDLGQDESVSGTALAAASILAVAMLIIATVTVGIMVVMFIIRIIFLWILIVLSPFAFVLSAAPGFSGKFNEWWDKFMRYVFVGPLLAFFLWLAFSIMSSVQPNQNLATQNKIKFSNTSTVVEEGTLGAAGRTSAAITEVSRSDNLLSFGIAISLLLLALTTANSIGVAGGKLAGSAMAKIQSGGLKLAKGAALFAATGGVGLAAYGAYRGTKAAAKTMPGKWAGRRLDEKITPWATKGIGKIGSKVFGPETSILGFQVGKASRRLAERGMLARTFKQSWKERAESREKNITAPYIGSGRDVLNSFIDNKDTNYEFRHVMALANEEAKKQRDESDNTSEAFLNPVYKALRGGKVQNTKEIKGALINVWGNNDQNEITLSEEEHHREIDQATGQERVVTIGEHINRQVVKNFEERFQKENPEGLTRARNYMAAKQRVKDAVARGASTEEVKALGQQAAAAKKELKPLELEYVKHKQNKAVDSSFARVEALKMLIGDSDEAKQFAARLSGLALENKNYAGFAIAGNIEGQYDYRNLYSEDGFQAYNGAVMGKMRNIPPPDLFRGHPSSFRDETINLEGMRKYDDVLNTVGNNLMLLASALLSERNFAPRPDTSTGLIGGVAQREYPDLYDVDPEKREQARVDLSQDMLLGFDHSLRPFGSEESLDRAVLPYLQRGGIPKGDFDLTPNQLLARHQEKLSAETQALNEVNTALGQATDPAEISRLKAEAKKVKDSVERLQTQIVRFVEGMDPALADQPIGTVKARVTTPRRSAASAAGEGGPTIATPGSAEFQAAEAELRRRPPQT